MKFSLLKGARREKLEYIKSVFRLRKLLSKQYFDIIHCHHVFSALCLLLSGQVKKNNSIVSYQSDLHNEKGKFIYRLIKKYFKIIILKNGSSPSMDRQVHFQSNGVNVDFFKPMNQDYCFKRINLQPNKKYILFVSSSLDRKVKRYDRFQQIMQILKEKYYLKDIEELKLINTERSLVPYYFNAANVHLLTSDFEGSPNSVKEAMACNIPVVSTNVGNVNELLQHVNGSYVSETTNPEELAELVYKTLTENTANNGREQLIKQELDMESVAKKIINIYHKIVD